MGVTAVEVVLPFDAKLRKLDNVRPMPSPLRPGPAPAGYITRRTGNNDYAVINALLAKGFDVSVLTKEHESYPVGSVVITGRAGDADRSPEQQMREVQRRSIARNARFDVLPALPDQSIRRKMSPPRTALYQPWTASMDEGWTRFVLEKFAFPYASIHNGEIRAGNLRGRFDCIIIPDLSLSGILAGRSSTSTPPPYAGGIGDDGAMQLERFVEAGGTLVLMDSATELATDLFRVPARNVLDGLPRDEFFCPGSILRIRVDNTHPLGYGFDDEAAAYFAHSKAFVLGKEALEKPDDSGRPPSPRKLTDEEIKARLEKHPVNSVATYSDNIVLLSGWILGDDNIRSRTAVAEVEYGGGRIVLFGFRVQHRGQPWGTFKFLFNAIYRSTLK